MVKDRWVPVRSINLHLRERRGEGVPFLLLHGLASNCLTWEAVARRLEAAGHTVVAVDQRGHGLSDKPGAGYGFDEVTADLRALIDALETPQPPLLVGQSWGGNVVLDFAARYPGVTQGLVLVDGGFLELSSRPGATWDKVAVDLKPPPLAGMRRTDLAERLRRGHPQWTEEGIESTLGNFETLPDGTIRPWLTLDRHMEILRALWDYHPPQLYPRVSEPVLLLPAAVADPGRAEQKRLAVEMAQAELARCRVRWFDATDHDIHVHRPDELVSAILEAMRDHFFDPSR